MASRWGALAYGVALVLSSRSAYAAPTAQDKALAETLFRDGRSLMQAGKLAEACSKLADSMQLDPQMGTLLNVALCHEQQGKTASAWAAFVEVSDANRASEPARAAFARKHADDLEKKLSLVQLKIDPKTTDRVAIDGQALASSALPTSFPLDPGDHQLDVSAPGKIAFHTTVKVPAGPSKTEVPVPVLESETPAATTPRESATAMPPPREPEKSNTKRTVGFVLGGVGLVGLGVGTAFGIMTLSKKSDADKECTADRCSQAGLDLDSEAMTSAVVSTIGFGVGLVGLGVGTYLVLTSKSSTTTGSISVAPMFGGTNGAQLQGRF